MPNYLEMVRLHEAGFSLRQIAKIVGSGRSTVTRTVNIAQEKGLGYEGLSQWSVKEIEELFRVSQKKQAITYHVMPNYEALSKDLVKPGVTMQLLWEEYAQTCRLNGQIYYQLTQFKKYFNDYLNKTRFSHILNHKAGEQIQVDWAGTRPHWVDPTTGEIIKGELFVGTLPFSNYTYAQACVDQKSASWIDAHVNMFKFFNGVSTLLIPDNLRVGVTKHTKNELILNSTYEDMATYYQTIVVPTRVYRPKD